MMLRLPAQSVSPHRPEVQHKTLEDLLREVDELRKHAEQHDSRSLPRQLEISEGELSEERLRSVHLRSELEELRSSSASVDGQIEANAPLVEMRRAMSELEQRNHQLAFTVETLEREREHETSSLQVGSRRLHQEGCILSSNSEDVGSPTSRAAVSDEAAEVRLLRTELAERDRELRAVAAARRRCANQSERTVDALRTKLNELEAIVAATPTPSTSSRASSPRGSERGRDVSSPAAAFCVERGVQTELESISSMRSTRSQDVPPLCMGSTWAALDPQIEDSLGLWGTSRVGELAAELLKRHDANTSGRLAWRTGEVASFLDDFFKLQCCSTPKLPPALLSTMCNQIRKDSSEGDAEGLSAAELCSLIKRVRELGFGRCSPNEVQRSTSDAMRWSAPASPKGRLDLRVLQHHTRATLGVPHSSNRSSSVAVIRPTAGWHVTASTAARVVTPRPAH